MRAAKKEIKDPAVITDLLNRCHAGRLGTIGADGSPMIKPLNFVYLDGDIYFHSARCSSRAGLCLIECAHRYYPPLFPPCKHPCSMLSYDTEKMVQGFKSSKVQEEKAVRI